MLKNKIYFLILFLFSFTSYAGTIYENAKDEDHLEFGAKFNHTIVVTGLYEEGKSFLATGVAIRPNYVLTAAHVVKKAKTCIIIIDKRGIVAEEIICHEEFDEEIYGKNDIALLKLSGDVKLDWYSPLYESDDEVGKLCSMSGYGATGNFVEGFKEGDLKKRAGSNIIDRIDSHLLITSASRENRTSLEFLIAVGDSGGPLYINNKLAGIHSCVMSTDGKSDSSYGDDAGHTRVSIFKDWIKNKIGE